MHLAQGHGQTREFDLVQHIPPRALPLGGNSFCTISNGRGTRPAGQPREFLSTGRVGYGMDLPDFLGQTLEFLHAFDRIAARVLVNTLLVGPTLCTAGPTRESTHSSPGAGGPMWRRSGPVDCVSNGEPLLRQLGCLRQFVRLAFLDRSGLVNLFGGIKGPLLSHIEKPRTL